MCQQQRSCLLCHPPLCAQGWRFSYSCCLVQSYGLIAGLHSLLPTLHPIPHWSHFMGYIQISSRAAQSPICTAPLPRDQGRGRGRKSWPVHWPPGLLEQGHNSMVLSGSSVTEFWVLIACHMYNLAFYGDQVGNFCFKFG